MGVNIKVARQRILNKWDWDDNSISYPTILWGPPGIGKSELVYSLVCDRMLAELEEEYSKGLKSLEKSFGVNFKETSDFKDLERDYKTKKKILNFDFVTPELLEIISKHCLVIRLAERPIEQLQGVIVPSLSDNKNCAKFLLPENIINITRSNDWGIVFLDELDKASESKFGAATHLLENKVIGDLQLNENWYVLAAANRVEDSFLSNPIPPELRNRCANIEVDFDPEVWIEWAIKHNIRKDIVMFHKFNNGAWLAKYDLEQTFSFPTPRTWTMASRVLDNLERKYKVDRNNPKDVQEFDEVIRHELADFVGKQAAAEFFTYKNLYLKFNVQDILTGKQRVNGNRHDRSLVSDQCVAAFAMADGVTPEMLSQDNYINNLIQFIKDLQPEARTIYLQSIHKNGILDILAEQKEAQSILEEMVKYIAI